MTRYREFSVKHPNQTDYYRPILDMLDVVPSKFDNIQDVVMLEGKNDFYTLKYISNILNIKKGKFNLLPGTRSSNLENIIKLYIAWGRSFIVLLDSDKEGKSKKEKYSNLFETLLQDKIFDLDDIDPEWKIMKWRNYSNILTK